MDSKLYRELSEAYLNVYAPKEILESKDEEEKEEEEEDTKKKSSKKGEDEEDEDEMEEMDEAVENLDEISANLALTASQKADEERRKAAVSGDKATAAKKAAQASRLYKGVGPRRTRERMGGMKEEVDVYDEIVEFLCVEGFAETLEEAEWMMANVIDENAIEIIVGEGYQRNPEKGEKEDKKYAPVRGEKTPMPPRGDKRREDFEKWYAKLNVADK
jgi:hypothetical protein